MLVGICYAQNDEVVPLIAMLAMHVWCVHRIQKDLFRLLDSPFNDSTQPTSSFEILKKVILFITNFL